LEQAGPAADPNAGLPLAVLSELDGKLSRAGLESLGLDIGAHNAVYGMGAFPVVRIGLSDPGALRATVQRVFERAGLTVPEQSFQGVPYWRLADEHQDELAVGLYLAILDDHLAAGVLPPSAEQALLPAFLALEKPADSDAGARLLALNEAQDYTPYGSGILDLHRLADQFLQPDALTAEVIAASGNDRLSSLGPACVSEIHAIIDQAPRMTAGTTELSAAAIGYQYRVESPSTLAGRLMDLVADIPAVEAVSSRMIDLAFGMRFGAVRDFVQQTASAIVADPFECEQLKELNDGAADTLARLDQPLPPFLNNFRGIRISLDDIRVDGATMPADASGHLAVHVEQPEMFVGMAQMFLPDLSNLALTAGDPPVRVPESLMPATGMVAYAAMSKDAIGLSVGAGEEQGLPAFLDRDPGPEGMFLSASYDTAAYLDLTSRYTAARQRGQYDEEYEAAADAARAIAEAGRAAFRAAADRSLTTLRFGSDGLVIDGRMTFR
ncbi:MAG: hypothetical protein HKP16_09430, partial [Xanthomonadales bacterium]|nr:hypothetical protein [Xanthomonadales bacterium]